MSKQPKITKGDIGKLIAQEPQWHINVGQVNVVTTEDKLRMYLTKYLERVESRNTWQVPFGIALALGPIFLTADFKQFIFSADTWRAFFFLALLLSVGWLIVTVVRRPKTMTIEQVVQIIKSGESTETQTVPPKKT